MPRRRKANPLRRAARQRLLSSSNRGWVLDPLLAESEEWSECVRSKLSRSDQDELQSDPDSTDESDDFDE